MPFLRAKIPDYKPSRDLTLNWDNFRRGLNILLKETEVDKDELVQADNLFLIGKGVPTKRWGTKNYFLSSATGSVRGLQGFYQKDGTNQLLALADEGYLVKKSNASYSSLTGVSWASGHNAFMTQLDNKMYIVNGQRELVRYSNPTLVGFPTIAVPANVFATQVSGVSGTNRPSYRVSAVSNVGETLASEAIQAANCPQDLADGSVKVSWTATSAASGVLQGYNIFGRDLGDERFLGGVGTGTTFFIDNGSAIPEQLTFPQTADSTGGINAKYMTRFDDRLIFAGIDGEPSKVIISGRVPFQERISWSYGGGYILIEPDSGDDITGIGTFGNRIIVWKERSIWQITLTTASVGSFTVLIPTVRLITSSHGSVSPRSIVAVENDVFFLSRRGVYALGYEPNIAVDVLRTNEISSKVRPFFDNLTYEQLQNATAAYYMFKYILSFPGRNETIVYDRERLAWMGPWNKDARVYETYTDSAGTEHLLYGSDDSPDVIEYSASFGDDNGTAITTHLRTKKDDFKNWAAFKNIKEVFTLFRNVQGSVNVSLRLQKRDGTVATEKSFNIQTTGGNAGFGADLFGNTLFGDSEETGGATDVSEIYRYILLNKAARNMQLDIQTINRNDNYELLAVKANARPLGYGFLPSGERV